MNLLAVDDEREVVEALKQGVAWREIGIDQVYTAISAMEGREILRQAKIDILLCDIEMPRENGLSFCRFAKEQYPELECIFLTSHAEFDYAREALLLGSCDYILQPASYKEIAESVGRAMEKIRQKREHSRLEQQGKEMMDSFLKLLEKQGSFPARTEYKQEQETGTIRTDAGAEGQAGQAEGRATGEYLVSGSQKGRARSYKEKFGRSPGTEWEEAWTAGKTGPFREEAGGGTRIGQRGVPGVSVGYLETEDEDQERIKRVVSYIQNHLDQDLTRNELAEYIHLNPEYFSKYFKKQTGYLLKDYILQEKMKLAKHLLANTSLSINMVATRVGYFNFSHFSKAFKKLEGMTPGEYRQAAKQK